MGPKKKPAAAAVVKKTAKKGKAVPKAGVKAKAKQARTTSTGRTEFETSVKREALQHALCGRAPDVECCHVGYPASQGLREMWLKAMQEVYWNDDMDAEFGWCDRDTTGSNCLAMPHSIHTCYDNNNAPKAEDTKIIAFLPANLLPDGGIDVKPGNASADVPSIYAFVLARGREARDTIRHFIAMQGAINGITEIDGNTLKIGESIEVMRVPNFEAIITDLKKHEFDYEEEVRLALMKSDGSVCDAEYNATNKKTIAKEIALVANFKECDFGHVRDAPDWFRANHDKYVRVKIASPTVHWFYLRVRACRLLQHRVLGGLPNQSKQNDDGSEDYLWSDSEVKELTNEATAWPLYINSMEVAARRKLQR